MIRHKGNFNIARNRLHDGKMTRVEFRAKFFLCFGSISEENFYIGF